MGLRREVKVRSEERKEEWMDSRENKVKDSKSHVKRALSNSTWFVSIDNA